MRDAAPPGWYSPRRQGPAPSPTKRQAAKALQALGGGNGGGGGGRAPPADGYHTLAPRLADDDEEIAWDEELTGDFSTATSARPGGGGGGGGGGGLGGSPTPQDIRVEMATAQDQLDWSLHALGMEFQGSEADGGGGEDTSAYSGLQYAPAPGAFANGPAVVEGSAREYYTALLREKDAKIRTLLHTQSKLEVARDDAIGRAAEAERAVSAARNAQYRTGKAGGAWSETSIRDTSCCCHPLTGVPYLRPGPRRQGEEGAGQPEQACTEGQGSDGCDGGRARGLRSGAVRHPELKLKIPAELFCMSWCPDFEFRVT